MKNVLSIAGTDPTGGAGIQTDLKTFEAHGVYGMAVISAVVAQNTFHVTGMQAVPADLVGRQIDCVFEDIRPDAVKIGMLYDKEIIHKTAECLRAHHAKNIVLDPVMMSSSGQVLLQRDAADALIGDLFPLCTLVTPDLGHEAAAICGHEITDRDGMEQAAKEIAAKTGGAVLVKGGHLADCADDLLFDGETCHWFPSPRIDNPNTHGTGCTLSSAIACNLAEGHSLRRASAAPSSISPPASPMVSTSAACRPPLAAQGLMGKNFRKQQSSVPAAKPAEDCFLLFFKPVPAAAFGKLSQTCCAV